MSDTFEPTRVRAIFLSDVHLGTRACRADALLDFLRRFEADTLYLVGDIIDFWSMSRMVYWSTDHNTVIQKLLRRARHGARVVMIPGNHDELIREYHGQSFGGIEVCAEAVHVGGDGRRYLVLHGDAFDQLTRYHHWMAGVGDGAYHVLMRLSGWLSWLRRTFGVAGHWSLSGYVKGRLRSARDYVDRFEDVVSRYAGDEGYDGVICGHIHAAADRLLHGIRYLNCGDWVDSCSALVEELDGQLHVVHWRVRRAEDGKAVAAVQGERPRAA